MTVDRVEEIKKQIADIKKRWPAHSIPPALMAQLDELDEELALILKKQKENHESRAAGVDEVR